MHSTAIIIDDDPISVLVCETMLRKCAFAKKIHSLKSGAEGLAFFKDYYKNGNTIPDFIFLDIQMPGMSGWAFLDAYSSMEELPHRIPHVVMLSATFDPDDRAKAEEHPLVMNFLSKPVTKEALDNLSAEK